MQSSEDSGCHRNFSLRRWLHAQRKYAAVNRLVSGELIPWKWRTIKETDDDDEQSERNWLIAKERQNFNYGPLRIELIRSEHAIRQFTLPGHPFLLSQEYSNTQPVWPQVPRQKHRQGQ